MYIIIIIIPAPNLLAKLTPRPLNSIQFKITILQTHCLRQSYKQFHNKVPKQYSCDTEKLEKWNLSQTTVARLLTVPSVFCQKPSFTLLLAARHIWNKADTPGVITLSKTF